MTTPDPAPVTTSAEDARELDSAIQKLIDSAPAHIWLDLGEETHLVDDGTTFRDLAGVTWSENNATGIGIKYVLAPKVLSRADVDRIVYACRQSGDDSTYAIVNAALRAALSTVKTGGGVMALRWRKNPAEKGLRRIGAGPRGSGLYLDNDLRVASVSALRANHRVTGWFWSTPANQALGIAHHNSCTTPVATEQEAKDEAVASVKDELATAKSGGSA